MSTLIAYPTVIFIQWSPGSCLNGETFGPSWSFSGCLSSKDDSVVITPLLDTTFRCRWRTTCIPSLLSHRCHSRRILALSFPQIATSLGMSMDWYALLSRLLFQTS
ncbi:hypothetical protein AcW1_007008 [Taiwanofungus camphoratus]|nr:hypothetical protein AcV5_002810 [Antrodia cinnamomea]KAI0955413.1 hypothetical protein AcW1_007008 [Antrodia cinnamomea]